MDESSQSHLNQFRGERLVLWPILWTYGDREEPFAGTANFLLAISHLSCEFSSMHTDERFNHFTPPDLLDRLVLSGT